MTKYIYIFLTLAFVVTSCAIEEDMQPSANDKTLTISANMVTESDWNMATRAMPVGYRDCKIYYTNHKGVNTVYDIPEEDLYTGADNEGHKIFIKASSDFVWQMIQRPRDGSNPTIYLSYFDEKEGVMVLGKHEPVYESYTFHFDKMEYTQAKLTLNLRLTHNFAQDPLPQDFTATVTAKIARTFDKYNPWGYGKVWPCDGTSARAQKIQFTDNLNDDYVYASSITGSTILPQQKMENSVLELTYNNNTATIVDDIKWSVDLSKIQVTGGKDEQKANELYAGQNLVLNLTAGITNANDPEVEVEAFVAGTGAQVNGTAEPIYTYSPETNTYTTSTMQGFDAWLKAWIEQFDPIQGSPVKLETTFPTAAVDIKIPEKFLSDYYHHLFRITNTNNELQLGKKTWKSISLVNDEGNVTGVLGSYVNGTNHIITVTINGVEHAVTFANIIDDEYNISRAAKDLKFLFDNGFSSFYVLKDLVPCRKHYDYSTTENLTYGYINAMSTFGAAVELMYDRSYNVNSFDIQPAVNIVLADATSLPDNALFDTQVHNLYLPKVTSLGSYSLSIKSPTNYPDDGLRNISFGKVITGYEFDNQYKVPFFGVNTQSVTLTLNEEQKNSQNAILNPDKDNNTWGGYTWKEIKFQ